MVSTSDPAQLSIRRLFNTSFNDLYEKLVLGQHLESTEFVKLLSIAVILANQSDLELNRLGYRIVLLYGNSTNDYIPLYDISLNTGLIPVANLVKNFINSEGKWLNKTTFVEEFTGSFIDSFRENQIVHTEQQFVLNEVFRENINESIYVVAPTSYGKSELIISSIRLNPNKKFCILVPSKSLLSQTKKRLLNARIDWVTKIVTHPEMHEESLENSVYILTQERLSRLLNIDQGLSFDFLFVDEAHNLLEKDSRNELLASVISILNFRNKKLAIKYLTPFLTDTSNLNLRTAAKVELEFLIDEYVKTERFFTADFREGKNEHKLYEQFSNRFYNLQSSSHTAIEYLLENSVDKNIIYFNKPKDIEKFVVDLASSLDLIDDNDVNIAIEELSISLDGEYRLIECLKKGVVYHHGSMTDTVRHYVEYLFNKSPNIRYLVSSSTLLEGVNMPIERIFLMSCSKGQSNLTASQFKNLIGRVNRFSEIFTNAEAASLKKLEPEIHIVASDGYIRRTANLDTFLKSRVCVTKNIKDKPKNVLLEKVHINSDNQQKYDNALSRLENLERGIIEGYDDEYVSTSVGKLLIAGAISEIDVFSDEQNVQDVLDDIDEESIVDSNTLLDIIYRAFIEQFEVSGSEDKHQLSRLGNIQAQTFYAMMLDWKMAKTPFKLMIRRFISYWDELYQNNPNAQVYVGKWGDEPKDDGGFIDHYTRINRKNQNEKINLAIVRIKEEEDFIEHALFRFIDILNDLNLIEESFFKHLKYGTTDEKVIALIRHGLSRGVAELILSKYVDYLELNLEKQIVSIDPKLLNAMKDENESILQLFEVEMNTGIDI